MRLLRSQCGGFRLVLFVVWLTGLWAFPMYVARGSVRSCGSEPRRGSVSEYKTLQRFATGSSSAESKQGRWLDKVTVTRYIKVVHSTTNSPTPSFIKHSPTRADQQQQTFITNNPRRRGFLWCRITGDGTPYKFPRRPLAFTQKWPPEMPFGKYDFSRLDPYNDGIFYSIPRPVYHLDEPAIAALTQYYRHAIPPGSDILDLCSSWVSHYPLEFPETMGHICATGMNYLELAMNDQLQNDHGPKFQVVDLNQSPVLPYSDESFDVVTCVASIDYLIYPIQVLQECHRVLRPGGKVIISFSNRCFGLKAIKMWLRSRSPQHLEIINAFFHYAGGFGPRQAFDITAQLPTSRYQDPLYVVEATNLKQHQ